MPASPALADAGRVDRGTLNMTPIELITTSHEPAARSRTVKAAGREAAARGFLIQLVAREIQTSEHVAGWLTTIAETADPRVAQACTQLAAQTWTLREQLIELEHRLVARWNQIPGRRPISAHALASQGPSPAMRELIAFHTALVSGPKPWLELAALRPLEQMLAGAVPLALDVAGIDDVEFTDAAQLFAAREQRASTLDSLLVHFADFADELAEVEEQAVAAFSQLLAECAAIGRELDHWRHGFIRQS
jgi:hypothetical protein